MSRVFKEKTCEVCGTIFTPTGARQKTCCKACTEIARREYLKNYHRNGPVRNRKKVTSPFSETIQYAKKHDISYGEAVARMDKERGVRVVIDNTPGVKVDDNPRKNGEGYSDPTAYAAIKNIESVEDEKFNRLIRTIFSVATLAGFEVQGRITFVSKETGRIYK